MLFLQKKPVINYTVYECKNAPENGSATTNQQWVTFVHGAGGSSSLWFKQIRDFQKHHHVLLLDLRGHGQSKSKIKQAFQQKYTFSALADDILEVLNHLQLEKSLFVGMSLGTILIRQLAEMYPDRVQTMVMGGAILKMNFRSQILMKLGNAFKYILPYLLLYRLFAFVIMPKKTHKKSRILFINEAKKLYQKEFIKWFRLTAEINPVLKWFRQVELDIPTFYVMGKEDYMFLPSVQKVVASHYRSSKLLVIENCGHVVNVEQAAIFNKEVLQFIQATA